MPALTCPRCRAALPDPGPWGAAVSIDLSCPNCNAIVLGRIFTRHFVRGDEPEQRAAADGSAVCHTHDSRAAVAMCDHCGRGLCSLCDLPVGGKHVCSACLGKLDKDGQIATLKNHEVLHDDIALALALIPILLWPFTLVTAPLALFYAVRHWNAPKNSMLPRSRVRLYIACLFALVQCAGWGWLFFNIFLKVTGK